MSAVHTHKVLACFLPSFLPFSAPPRFLQRGKPINISAQLMHIAERQKCARALGQSLFFTPKRPAWGSGEDVEEESAGDVHVFFSFFAPVKQMTLRPFIIEEKEEEEEMLARAAN